MGVERNLVAFGLILLATLGRASLLPAPALAQVASAPIEEDVALTIAPGAQVRGTLLVPKSNAAVPVVLIISGSGPTDRNGNTPLFPRPNNSLRMLAEALAVQGIASLRYDKRGIGQSSPANERDARFDMFVDDAVAWIARVRTDSRFSHVVVAGHSEGSLIGMAASSRARVEGFVSIAGAGHRAVEIIRGQLRSQLATSSAWPDIERTLESIDAGAVVDPLPSSIASVTALLGVFRPSVQPYVISWNRYVPSTLVASLKIPVVIAQGTTDVQVGVDEAKVLMAAKPDATLLLIDGMNHVLKRAPADPQQNIATYSDPTLPIVAELPNGITQFVRRVAGQR
jgi:pimeloyl-ACP methyl ester carboxylesterase